MAEAEEICNLYKLDGIDVVCTHNIYEASLIIQQVSLQEKQGCR